MRYLIIILLLFSSCAKGQRQVLGINKNGRDQVTQPLLVLIPGESNAGGEAPNASATTDELLPRHLQILHNFRFVFQNLEIGENNNIGHVGLDNTTHGMELGLANQYDDGDFNGHPVYLVKAGQGGSTIGQWTSAGAYFDTMRVRVQAAITKVIELTGQVPIVEVWCSIGINDRIAGTSTSTFKTAYKQFITDVRAMISTITGQTHIIPFLFTRFDSMPSNLAYETVFGQIASEVSDCYAVSTLGASILGDGNHWDYSGFKTVVVPAFVTIAITYL